MERRGGNETLSLGLKKNFAHFFLDASENKEVYSNSSLACNLRLCKPNYFKLRSGWN